MNINGSYTSNSELLNFEEFFTVFLQVEAYLNSRTSTLIVWSFSLECIPTHFLIGDPIHQFPSKQQRALLRGAVLSSFGKISEIAGLKSTYINYNLVQNGDIPT